MSNFEKLVAYQKWRTFARRMVGYYPRIRKKSRRLADQLERAIESIGDAVAEGRGRATDKDFADFLTRAQSLPFISNGDRALSRRADEPFRAEGMKLERRAPA